MNAQTALRSSAHSSSPVLVPRLELLDTPAPDAAALEPEDLDASDLADLLESEQARQNRGAWFSLVSVFVSATLLLLAVPLWLQVAGMGLLLGATYGIFWLVRSSLDKECAELGVSSRSLRRVLRRVYREHARTTLQGVKGRARQRKVAELVLANGRRWPRQLPSVPVSAR